VSALVLRPYQSLAVEAVKRHWASNKRRVLLVAPTGAGKTALAEEMIVRALARSDGADVWFLAHRVELLEQPARRFQKRGIDFGIVKAGVSSQAGRRVQIASVQTLRNRPVYDGTVKNSALVFIDECFPAGTLIDGRAIETVRVGDTVLSYDHDRQRVCRRAVRHLFKSRPSALVRVCTDKGRQIVTTFSHPVYTQLGYVPASKLNAGDTLYGHTSEVVRGVQHAVCPEILEPLHDPDLLAGMQTEEARRQTHSDRIQLCDMSRACNTDGQEIVAGEDRKSLLLPGLLESSEGAGRRPATCRIQPDARSSPHASEQSDAPCRDQGKNASDANRDASRTLCQGWQRERAPSGSVSAVEGSKCTASWLDAGVYPEDRISEKAISAAEPPEDRHSECQSTDSYRDRWPEPLLTGTQRPGREERGVFEVDRVASVEVLQRGSDGEFGGLCPDGYVYNLEVEDTHTYFADGILVHNCHRMKAQTYQHIIRDLERSYSSMYTVGLTATPYRLDGQGLGDVTDALVEAATPRQLMDEGFLTDDRPASRHLPGHTPCYVVGRPPPDKIDPRAVDEDGEFNAEAVEAVMDRPKLVGDAVDTWRKHCDGYPGIGRCRTKKSAMVRLEAFKAAGFRVGYLDGETPRRERQLLLARLAIGGQRSAHPMGLDVLLFVNVLTEGFDSESSYDLVLGECRKEIWGGRSQPPPYVPLCVLGDYALTKSMGAFIQFWGRGSRVHRDKPWLRLLSHAGNEDEHCYLSQHESFTLEHRQSDWLGKLRAKEAEQGVAVSDGGCDRLLCADCGTRWLLGTTICLHCGGSDLGPFRSKTRDADEGDEETPGELVEKVPDAEAPRPPTPFETENWFTKQFSWLRSENARRVSDGKRAMKPGVIIHKYRGIFKRDPDFGIYNRYRNQFGFTRE